MEDDFLDILRGPLWHTTHPNRYQEIIESGFIYPEPNIPNSERWKTARGPDFYPYVRHIGGVSLFDFNGFDPVEYSRICPMSSWRTFVPCRSDWKESIWIEIDRDSVRANYISPNSLSERQRAENAERHTLMPRIEAAVIGSIPVSAFRRILLCRCGCKSFEDIEQKANNNTAQQRTPDISPTGSSVLRIDRMQIKAK